MILVCQTERGQSPSILQFGIEGKAVVFDRQRSTMAENFHGAVEILSERGFEVLAPARGVRREAAERKTDGREIEACVQTATPVESDLIVIQFIKIMEDAAHGETFVVVERMLKLGKHGAAAVQHEILPDVAAGVSEALRKLFISRDQDEEWSVRYICTNHHCFGFL